MRVLGRGEWEPLARVHRERAEGFTAEHLERRLAGRKHPIWDFLFDYYGFKPGQLARWHPGAGVWLRDAPEYDGLRYYIAQDDVAGGAGAMTTTRRDGGPAAGADGPAAGLRGDGPMSRSPAATATGQAVDGDRAGRRGRISGLDAQAFMAARGDGLRFALGLLRASASRPARFDCFGLHEWAMVYRLAPDEVRHTSLPLRLGAEGTDGVVEAHELRCSHFDAFRFFTPAAEPRNWMRPERGDITANEQPGCLHGGAMDLYRWAFKFSPAVPGDLLLDCFELARDARLLDMQSSPYDLSGLGYANIPIETAAGKAEHVERQRALSARAEPLRERLISAFERVVAGAQA